MHDADNDERLRFGLVDDHIRSGGPEENRFTGVDNGAFVTSLGEGGEQVKRPLQAAHDPIRRGNTVSRDLFPYREQVESRFWSKPVPAFHFLPVAARRTLLIAPSSRMTSAPSITVAFLRQAGGCVNGLILNSRIMTD